MNERLTRRRLLAGTGTLAAGGTVAGVVAARSGGESEPQLPDVALGDQPPGLPARQHAWNATLATDRYGNVTAPLHDRLLFFDVVGTPTVRHRRLLEASLRALERSYPWGPHGLLFTAGWGHAYFAGLLRDSSAIPQATALSDFELPAIDEYHLCLHLACDDAARLRDVESALRGGTLGGALALRETRTGFTGAGLAAANSRVAGIPGGDPVTATTPLYMGFKSGLRKNQATEDAVTIPSGPFADGTTMAVSYMRLDLDSWYDNLTDAERAQRMYSPETTPADVARITDDAPSDPALLGRDITRYGVIGHSQTSARARRNGKPIILRRDFDTTDAGHAGLHFVSLQRSIADFVTTRQAMNASDAQLQNPAITDTVNNGINEFMFVLKRGNYLLPNRAGRSFPGLPAAV